MSDPIRATRAEVEIREYVDGAEIVVDGQVVLAWNGDGVVHESVEVETPKRQFPKTTTPHWRCLRMLFEEYADVILSAITDGPSRTGLRPAMEARGTVAERMEVLALLASKARTRAEEHGQRAGGLPVVSYPGGSVAPRGRRFSWRPAKVLMHSRRGASKRRALGGSWS